MGLVENDEAESAEEKHEAGRQALHYVLAVDAILEKYTITYTFFIVLILLHTFVN